jgi:flavorubredoxin
MASIDEIAPDIFRISVFAPRLGLSFNHFVVRDEEPLLFHAGFRAMFDELHEAVGRLIDPTTVGHIGFSHFESDECGALNQWLASAPRATPACGFVGAVVNLNDFAIREARILSDGDVLSTGRHRFRFSSTPHLPHGWDAGVMFEETGKTLFCSDLLLQTGETAALTRDSVVERARQALVDAEASPFAHATPYTRATGRMLDKLAAQAPLTLATMHGASFSGDGARELREFATVLSEVLGP